MTDLVVDKIATAIENDEYTIGIFLDLYNAFDTVRGVAGKHQKIGGGGGGGEAPLQGAL
jgi:hypothetical protein